MKIILTAVNATYNHTNLAIRYIAGYLRENHANIPGSDVCLREFSINDSTGRVLEILRADEGDVYAFSCYIWNITFILSVAADLKKIVPDAKIILGGPEVSYEDMSFFERNPYTDIIITGSGEKTLAGLLASGPIASGKRIIAGEPVAIEDKSFPYRSDELFEKGRQYYYETSAGCPFSCSYCLSGSQKGVEALSSERVKRELDHFINGKAGIVKLVDRTFNYDDNRACEIWRYLISRYEKNPFGTMFHFEISADLLSETAFEMLRTAPSGIFRFECGVQSANSDVLKKVHRNSDLSKILVNIRRLSGQGNIELHADLIAGLPGEDLSSLSRSYNQAYATGADMIQLGFLKLLKGSLLRKQALSLGIVYSDTPPYSVLSTPDISYREISLLRDIARMTEIYHNSGNFKFSLKYFMEHKYIEDPFSMYKDLSGHYRRKGGFARNFSTKDNVLTLLDFAGEVLAGDPEIFIIVFRDLLKLDKYSYDARGYIAELGMNMSSGHPDIPAGTFGSYGLKKPEGPGIRVRREKYCFNVSRLLEQGDIEEGSGFVLYDISGDRPVIIKTAFISQVQ